MVFSTAGTDVTISYGMKDYFRQHFTESLPVATVRPMDKATRQGSASGSTTSYVAIGDGRLTGSDGRSSYVPMAICLIGSNSCTGGVSQSIDGQTVGRYILPGEIPTEDRGQVPANGKRGQSAISYSAAMQKGTTSERRSMTFHRVAEGFGPGPTSTKEACVCTDSGLLFTADGHV